MSKIDLMIGDRYEVVLESLGSAGYGWKATIDDCANCIRVESMAPSEIQHPSPGGPPPDTSSRKIVFTITALAPGTSKLRFDLRRLWEHDVAPLESRTYVITVH